MEHLFSLGQEYRTHLVEGPLNDNLRKVFEEQGHPLLGDAVVSRQNENSWLIRDKDRFFTIEDEDNQLNISYIGQGRCTNPDCTASETGKCLESHENYHQDCQHFQLGLVLEQTPSDSEDTPTPTPKISPKESGRTFPFGMELGTVEATEIMRAAYTKLIGVVGETNTGKTCFLISLYLTYLNGMANEYSFAGSWTLHGFEHRARHVRLWEGGELGDKLADHTFLQDPRYPSLLHLIVKKNAEGSDVQNLLFTDLPGEWFGSLIDNVDTSKRLSFLERADGIVITVDSERLLNPVQLHVEVNRVKLLITRLVETINIRNNIPFIILITKCDFAFTDESDTKIGTLSLPGVESIKDEAHENGLSPIIIYSSAFSRYPDKIPHGHGINETLIELLQIGPREGFSKRAFDGAHSRRSFTMYRSVYNERGFR